MFSDLLWWALLGVAVLYVAIVVAMHLEGRYGPRE